MRISGEKTPSYQSANPGGPVLGVAGALLDIQGTLLDGSNREIPGAANAVSALKRAGISIRYVTNIDSVGAPTILARLEAAGIPATLDEVFSPVAALAGFLSQQPSATCSMLLPPELAEEVAAYAVEPGRQADFVVVGDMKEDFTYSRLNDALRQLRGGAQLVALSKGRSYLGAGGPILDTGAFVSALEFGAGVEAYVIGKPSTELLRLALQDMRVAPGDAVMVGDDAASDVKGGHAVGVRTVLVRTGKFSSAGHSSAGHVGPPEPDMILDSVADLPAALGIASRDAGSDATRRRDS